AFAQRRARFPVQDALDHRVVAVTACHAAWSGGVVLSLKLHASDVLNDVDEVVNGNQFARSQVDGFSQQVIAVGDHVDALHAVIDIHEASRGGAIAPDEYLVRTGVPSFYHLARNGGRNLLASAVPSTLRPVDVMEARDERLHAALRRIFLADH